MLPIGLLQVEEDRPHALLVRHEQGRLPEVRRLSSQHGKLALRIEARLHGRRVAVGLRRRIDIGTKQSGFAKNRASQSLKEALHTGLRSRWVLLLERDEGLKHG